VEVLHALEEGAYEQLVWCHDGRTGLRAIIAIHSTALGPALGGTRFYPYPDEQAALVDVLRLARGMTYKAALAGLDLGGGKAVILGDPHRLRSEALLTVYGRFVNSLSGRYVTAEDVGTTQADMDVIRGQTSYVTGVSESLGGSGDPSPATALGLASAMGAVSEHLWGTGSLEGRHVVVVGVGKVGSALVGHLVAAGTKVSVADIDHAKVRAMTARHGAAAVSTDDALTLECDVLAPCALGGVLDASTIPRLRCRAVCGSANNQLAGPDDARRLADAGIVYAPDYVVNAGGVINLADELRGYDRARARAGVAAIGQTTAGVLAAAQAEGTTTVEAADRLAEARLETVAGADRIRTFPRPT
jgi:valine dehydrogenase (NAD+)